LSEKAAPGQQVLSLADAVGGARVLLQRALGEDRVEGGEEEGGGTSASAVLMTLRGKGDGGRSLAVDLTPLLRTDAWATEGSSGTSSSSKSSSSADAAVSWCGQTALSLLALVGQGLARRAAAFAAADEAQAGAQRGYLLLIEEALRLARAASLRLAVLEEGGGNGKGKGVRRLLEAAHRRTGEVLEQMHALLSVPSFVAIIQVYARLVVVALLLLVYV
jgi:hypothetical protein